MTHDASTSTKDSQLHIYALLIAGMAFFGSATPVSKLVGDVFPVYFGAAARLLLAGIILLPFAMYLDKAWRKHSKKDWMIIAGVAIIGNIGFSFFMLYGMQMISGVMGSVIMSLTPALTAMAAIIFLSESIKARKIGALILGIIGVVIMHVTSGSGGQESTGNSWIGALLVFLAICCEAAYTLLGKVGSNTMKPITLAALSALLSGLLLLPGLIVDWPADAISQAGVKDWSALAWWGIGTMALGSLFWYRGVQNVPGHVAAGFMVVMPLSALLLSYFLLGEAFQWIHVVGFGSAIVGVALMIIEHRQQAGD